MQTRPALAPPPVATTIVCAALAAMVGVGLLDAVTRLFQHAGVPFEHVIVAEQACGNHPFASERDTCVRSRLAASARRNIARSGRR